MASRAAAHHHRPGQSAACMSQVCINFQPCLRKRSRVGKRTKRTGPSGTKVPKAFWDPYKDVSRVFEIEHTFYSLLSIKMML